MAEELTQPETTGDEGKYLEEVKRALSKDKRQLGNVWRLTQEGLDANEIAKELDVGTAGFVYNNRRCIEAIEEGKVPSSPSMAGQCASALRGFAKRYEEDLSPKTVEKIEKRAVKCDDHANDPAQQKKEERRLERQTSDVEKEMIPGIYVYVLPHYFNRPVDLAVDPAKGKGADDRTYLKVGKSERDVIKRFQQQRRSTALPESPKLLRIYVGSNGMDIADIEKKIHSHLEAADHVRNSERGAGTEWFLTHLKFLDSTAELLGLKIHFAFEGSDDD